jgi:hypothetical protein
MGGFVIAEWTKIKISCTTDYLLFFNLKEVPKKMSTYLPYFFFSPKAETFFWPYLLLEKGPPVCMKKKLKPPGVIIAKSDKKFPLSVVLKKN